MKKYIICLLITLLSLTTLPNIMFSLDEDRFAGIEYEEYYVPSEQNLSDIAQRVYTVPVFEGTILNVPTRRYLEQIRMQLPITPDYLKFAYNGNLFIEYVVRDKDTLNEVATKFYDDPLKWTVIYHFNQSLISEKPHYDQDNKLLTPVQSGIKLKIPKEKLVGAQYLE